LMIPIVEREHRARCRGRREIRAEQKEYNYQPLHASNAPCACMLDRPHQKHPP
jgi:hypothetical protein